MFQILTDTELTYKNPHNESMISVPVSEIAAIKALENTV